jgi:hypothetical protein
MLEEGRYGSIRELAAAERVDRAYVGRVMNLTLLAPDLAEAILNGRHPEVLSPPRPFEPRSMSWVQQWDALAAGRSV